MAGRDSGNHLLHALPKQGHHEQGHRTKPRWVLVISSWEGDCSTSVPGLASTEPSPAVPFSLVLRDGNKSPSPKLGFHEGSSPVQIGALRITAKENKHCSCAGPRCSCPLDTTCSSSSSQSQSQDEKAKRKDKNPVEMERTSMVRRITVFRGHFFRMECATSKNKLRGE